MSTVTVLERLPHLPGTRRGRSLALAMALLVWFGVYQLNEHLWDWLLYGVVGMDPASRTTETLHFFFYDTVKIALLLVRDHLRRSRSCAPT